MYYKAYYESPVGRLTLVSDEENLIGLWMEGQKYFESTLPIAERQQNEQLPTGQFASRSAVFHAAEEMIQCGGGSSVLRATENWLDRYFAGERPMVSELPLAPAGSAFRQQVWKLLCEIPYGEVVTYGELAGRLAVRTGRERMSAQAIGGAVGHNPIAIIIPCHRVVGADGSLTGYAGGVEKKAWLLELERRKKDGIIRGQAGG